MARVSGGNVSEIAALYATEKGVSVIGYRSKHELANGAKRLLSIWSFDETAISEALRNKGHSFFRLLSRKLKHDNALYSPIRSTLR